MRKQPWEPRWPTVQLGDASTSRLGKMLSRASKTGVQELPYLANADVQWGRIRLHDLRTMHFTEREQREFDLREGDVLICEGGEVGRTAVVERDLPGVFFQKAIHRVRCSNRLFPRFLFHYMRYASTRNGFNDYSSQATIMHLTGVKLRTFPVPLPPPEEQRRIAAILDKADELRAERRESLDMLDSFTESIFLDMFGDRHTNPCRYPIVPLSALVHPDHPITRGIDQPGPDVEDGVPYIKTTDFAGPMGRNALARAAKGISARFPRSVVDVGDSVICIRATVGPVVRITEELAGVNLSRGTARIAPGTETDSSYLYAALKSTDFQNQIKERLRGATFLQIPLGELRQLQVLEPPYAVQKEFAARSYAAHTARRRALDHSTQLDALFISLQHRAFRGEL